METFSGERLSRLGRVAEVAASPCGTWLAVSVAHLDEHDARYVHDLYRVPLDGGEPLRLTGGDTDERRPRFRSDGALGFLSDRAPDGGVAAAPERRCQLWILPAQGEALRLTDEPLGVSDFRFATAGDRLVVLASVLPGVAHEQQRETRAEQIKHGPSALRYRGTPVRYWDHWVSPAAPHFIAYDSSGQQRTDLTPGADREHREASWDLAADGSFVVTTVMRVGPERIRDDALRVLPIDGGEARDLAVRVRESFSAPLVSPDGSFVVATREVRHTQDCVRQSLVRVDLASGALVPVAEAWDRWAQPVAFTGDGALLASAHDEGQRPVFRVDLATSRVDRLTDSGTHDAVCAVPGGELIAGLRSRITHPPEPFVLEPGREPRLLACLSGFSPEEGEALASVESFTTAGSGGDPVQSFLLTPRDAEGPRPLLLWIHGGPINAFTDGWHWRWNALVGAAAGYAVALPNPRGSTGFGQAFIDGIWGNEWGAACYEDLTAVVDGLTARPDVDETRTMAMGGSFGGYMSNWIGGQTERFRCLITHASLFDLGAFQGSTDAASYFALHLGDDLESIDRYSPHRFVGQWKTPTLVIHGEKDYRVPIEQGLSLFEALQREGVESELLVFPDENHWIAKPRNVRVWYAAVLEFIGRHFRDPPQLQ